MPIHPCLPPLALLFCLAALVLAGCQKHEHDIRETRFMMGTLVEFTIHGVEESRARAAIRAAAAEMQRIDALFRTEGAPGNAVMRLNRAPVGVAVPLPEEVARLLRKAQAIEAASGHAFHIGLGRLNALWGFSRNPPPSEPPDAARIAALRPPAHCFAASPQGWRRLDARCALDFGAIAKGYAVDRGLAVLERAGIRDAIINAGGDLGILGRHGARPWRIGIRDPRKPGGVLASLPIEGRLAVVTSGDYERFFIHDGVRYHHILDPASGLPARKSRSATVIAPDAASADGWSTALFVLGAAGLARLPASWPALVVDGGGRIHANAPMRALLRR